MFVISVFNNQPFKKQKNLHRILAYCQTPLVTIASQNFRQVYDRGIILDHVGLSPMH